jgi:thymidylate synthase
MRDLVAAISEQYRLECEARECLKRCGHHPQRIKELLTRIKKKRGAQATEKLRQEIWRQWKNQ